MIDIRCLLYFTTVPSLYIYYKYNVIPSAEKSSIKESLIGLLLIL